MVFFLILLFAASTAFAQDEARKLVALLDYLGSDYKNAVQGGKIINQDEFTEMQEFSKRTLELLNKIKETDKADKAGVELSLKSLADQIENISLNDAMFPFISHQPRHALAISLPD